MVFMWLYVCTLMLIITTMQYSISLVLCICVRLQSYRFPIPSCTGQRPIHKNIHLHPKIWYAHLARLEYNHKMIHMNRIREVLSLILREVKKPDILFYFTSLTVTYPCYDFDLTSLDRFDLAGSVLQVSYVTYTKNPKDAFIIWPQSMKNVKFIAMIRLGSDKNYHPRLKIPLSVVSGQ